MQNSMNHNLSHCPCQRPCCSDVICRLARAFGNDGPILFSLPYLLFLAAIPWPIKAAKMFITQASSLPDSICLGLRLGIASSVSLRTCVCVWSC